MKERLKRQSVVREALAMHHINRKVEVRPHLRKPSRVRKLVGL